MTPAATPPAHQRGGKLLVVEVAVALRTVERGVDGGVDVPEPHEPQSQRRARLRLSSQPLDRLGIGGLRALGLTRGRRRSPAAASHAGWRIFSAALPLSCAISSSPSLGFALRKPTVCSRPWPIRWPLQENHEPAFSTRVASTAASSTLPQ